MTPLQQEAISIILRMSSNEVQEFALMLNEVNLENLRKQTALKKMVDGVNTFHKQEKKYDYFNRFMERKKKR